MIKQVYSDTKTYHIEAIIYYIQDTTAQTNIFFQYELTL